MLDSSFSRLIKQLAAYRIHRSAIKSRLYYRWFRVRNIRRGKIENNNSRSELLQPGVSRPVHRINSFNFNRNWSVESHENK